MCAVVCKVGGVALCFAFVVVEVIGGLAGEARGLSGTVSAGGRAGLAGSGEVVGEVGVGAGGQAGGGV